MKEDFDIFNDRLVMTIRFGDISINTLALAPALAALIDTTWSAFQIFSQT